MNLVLPRTSRLKCWDVHAKLSRYGDVKTVLDKEGTSYLCFEPSPPNCVSKIFICMCL